MNEHRMEGERAVEKSCRWREESVGIQYVVRDFKAELH
jgi:hypothetical protein